MGSQESRAGSARPTVSPGALLSGPTGRIVDLGQELHGFGGLHGGLLLGLLVSAMAEKVPDSPLRSVTGRFHRAVRGEFAVDADVVRSGRAVTVARAFATAAGEPRAEATATYGGSPGGNWPELAPAPPAAPPPGDCDRYVIPPDFVPISRFMEIRPVGPNRPYAGGTVPELTAWVRLVEDDQPPDPLRFVLLMDALAPSYSAVLSDLVLIPTVEITVRPSAALARAAAPWILLRARTLAAEPDGWNEETIDAWGADGAYLGTTRQLRLVRAP